MKNMLEKIGFVSLLVCLTIVTLVTIQTIVNIVTGEYTLVGIGALCGLFYFAMGMIIQLLVKKTSKYIVEVEPVKEAKKVKTNAFQPRFNNLKEVFTTSIF